MYILVQRGARIDNGEEGTGIISDIYNVIGFRSAPFVIKQFMAQTNPDKRKYRVEVDVCIHP